MSVQTANKLTPKTSLKSWENNMNIEYLDARIEELTRKRDELLAAESKFGHNEDYETGTILVWSVANGQHTIAAVKHSSGYWHTSYADGQTYTFETLIARIAGRPCYIVTEDRKSTRLNSSHVEISY